MTLVAEKIAYMEASWLERLEGEFEKPYMKGLEAFLGRETGEVYPPFELIFNAFCQTPFEDVKVVIMGQDPYHGPGQAHGLSFSVPKGVPLPPSLQNIFKELKEDLGVAMPSAPSIFKCGVGPRQSPGIEIVGEGVSIETIQPPSPATQSRELSRRSNPAFEDGWSTSHGCLIDWAKQGVLLLNATLTVRANEPKSHFGNGWEIFTDRVIQILCTRRDPIVFLLWGKSAFDKFQHIGASASHHLVLTAPHPSPFSAHSGFFGCRHFSKTNEFLKKAGKTPIDWALS